VGCEGSFHHLIALLPTVAGKPSRASKRQVLFSNEIKDLELILGAWCLPKPLKINDLANPLNVEHEAQRGAGQRM
jgi:hypothetical protein